MRLCTPVTSACVEEAESEKGRHQEKGREREREESENEKLWKREGDGSDRCDGKDNCTLVTSACVCLCIGRQSLEQQDLVQ